MSTKFTISAQALKDIVPKYIEQIDNHRDNLATYVLDQYIGKTFKVGHLWWKKSYNINTYIDACEYIEKHDHDALCEYNWARWSHHSLYTTMIEFQQIFKSSLDVIHIDINVDDVINIVNWETFYKETYGTNNE